MLVWSLVRKTKPMWVPVYLTGIRMVLTGLVLSQPKLGRTDECWSGLRPVRSGPDLSWEGTISVGHVQSRPKLGRIDEYRSVPVPT